jgi:hypothetical protein
MQGDSITLMLDRCYMSEVVSDLWLLKQEGIYGKRTSVTSSRKT